MLGPVALAALMLAGVPLLYGFLSFGRAMLKVTPAYRAESIASLRQAPARFSGPLPERVRRIPGGYILAMEAVGGLFGWPGVGWLYAGQVMPGIAMLMIGPAIAWALLPMLFSPFTNTVLSQWNWHVLLVWLPGTALLSSALLWRRLGRRRQAQAAAAQNDQTAAPKLPGRRARRIPRRLMFGTGFVMLALFSGPVIPLVAGIPSSSSPQQLASELPDRANGAYLVIDDGSVQGLLKLFAWSFPLDEPPQDAPAVAPEALAGFFIQQKGLDDPGAYRLYHLEDGDAVALTAQVESFQKQMRLTPLQALEAGTYMLDVPSGGMFAGREYYYFRVDPSATAPAQLSSAAVEIPANGVQ